MPADGEIQDALTLFRRGELVAAATICRAIIQRQPGHFGALHLLGIIAFQSGQAAGAIELIGQALAVNPNSAEAHINRGTAQRHLGNASDALASFDAAIALRPDHPEAHHNRGAVLRSLGRREEAVSSFDQAIALRPEFAAAYFDRGGTHRDLGQHAAALADFDHAVTLRPDVAEAYNNRGNALRDLGRPAAALADYDRAIALRPDFAEAHNNRGTVLAELERPSDALQSYDRAIALDPGFAAAHGNRGNTLMDLGRLEAALSSHQQAIMLNPESPDAHNGFGAALAAAGQFEEALAHFDRALTSRPDRADTHANRGNALRALSRHEAALASYATAIALQPDHAGARWNQSLCQLATGDYEHGWPSFEWRWKSELSRAKRDLSGPSWLGDFSLANQTIFVHAEQGLGDILQFCRYVPMLAARADVVLEVPRPLVRLLAGLNVRMITAGEPPPRYDAWIPLLSLPLAFRTTIATIPATIPYLHADPQRSARWRERVTALPGRKVGLVWAGSPRPEQPGANLMDRRRSVTLAHYAPLATIAGPQLISLQKGEAAMQARRPPAGMALHDWTDELDDFADTAALIEALDLVISVDTSVVHLAGALGKPVWVLNRYDQCWRWLRNRTDSPWYPTARLFRQQSPGDWDGVIRDVTEALRAGQ